jgi:hypothetical protein
VQSNQPAQISTELREKDQSDELTFTLLPDDCDAQSSTVGDQY